MNSLAAPWRQDPEASFIRHPPGAVAHATVFLLKFEAAAPLCPGRSRCVCRLPFFVEPPQKPCPPALGGAVRALLSAERRGNRAFCYRLGTLGLVVPAAAAIFDGFVKMVLTAAVDSDSICAYT